MVPGERVPGSCQRAAGLQQRARLTRDALEVLGPPPQAQPLTSWLLVCVPPEGFARRKKTSLWFVGSLLVVSTSILTVGLAATTRTENVTMGGYYPGIIVSVVVPGVCRSGGLGATGTQMSVCCRHAPPQSPEVEV